MIVNKNLYYFQKNLIHIQYLEGLKLIIDKFKTKMSNNIDLSNTKLSIPLLSDVIHTTLFGSGDSDQHLMTMFSVKS